MKLYSLKRDLNQYLSITKKRLYKFTKEVKISNSIVHSFI